MYNGIINIKKEKGFTSHDVVAKLRGIVGQRKIGHTGTLDPDATGVLPVCLGKATKVCELLTDTSKEYRTTVLLGVTTDTQDTSGEVLSSRDTSALNEQQVMDCILSFIGEYQQIPPMYSAIKINGKKLYELARQGMEVERKARTVILHEIEIESIDLPRITMRVHCSKGTYIRTLCHDIGEQLNCGGCMEELVRTRVGIFELDSAVTLSEVEAAKQDLDGDTFTRLLYAIDSVFPDRVKCQVHEESLKKAMNGSGLRSSEFVPISQGSFSSETREILLYDVSGDLIGLYVKSDQGIWKCKKFFYSM